MLAAIAWRNLWRNKLRSAVIITAIAIGIIGTVVTDGFMSGMTDQRVNAAIANEVSNIQIHNPAFLLNEEIKYTIPQAQKTGNTIRKNQDVKAVSLRLKCQAMASSAIAGAGVTVYGIRPDDEKQVSALHEHIIKGNYLSGKQRFSAIIGQKLAKKLDLGMDDKVIVTLADTTGTITSGAFQIVGIFKTSNDMFDESHVFILKSDMAKLMGFSSASSNEIAILLNNNHSTRSVVRELNKTFKKEIAAHQIVIQSWDQILPILKSLVEIMDYFSYLFLLIILVALAFAIINTMLMAVMERTREIGILMALGLSKRKIFSLIVLETVFLSITGALVGILISISIVYHYSIYGFDLSFVAGGLNSIGYSSTIFFRVSNNFYLATAIMVILIAVL
ncbi:MAG TPA: ABC transporter permease, partial [Candidatus Marinimicrobia bacterium]|nr:ABC transporter permease [Candidatus Neomarinimicrobiota bacterium]